MENSNGYKALYTGIPDVLYREPPKGGQYPKLATGVAYGKPICIVMPKRRYNTDGQPEDPIE